MSACSSWSHSVGVVAVAVAVVVAVVVVALLQQFQYVVGLGSPSRLPPFLHPLLQPRLPILPHEVPIEVFPPWLEVLRSSTWIVFVAPQHSIRPWSSSAL